jgi:hypothetical protein
MDRAIACPLGRIPRRLIVVESDTMAPTRYGPGDVIFFGDGAHALMPAGKRQPASLMGST